MQHSKSDGDGGDPYPANNHDNLEKLIDIQEAGES